jgi:hypothetical protein
MTHRYPTLRTVLALLGTTVIVLALLLYFGREPAQPIKPPPTQTVTPVHTWTVYDSSARGFALEYPSDVLGVEEGDSTEPNSVSFNSSDTGTSELRIQVMRQKTDAPDATAYFTAQSPTFFADRNDLGPTSLGGVAATRQTDTDHTVTTFFAVHDGMLYTVIVALPATDTEHVRQSFEFKP